MEKDVKIKEDILLIAKEVNDLKGENTLALDLEKETSWTSYFIITTCNSNAHMNGVLNEVRKLIYDLGYSIKQNRKNHNGKDWILLDCVDFVIHLMSADSREFYNLEEKWENSEVIYSSSSKLS